MGGHANQAAECLGALQHRDECLPETEAHVIPVEVATGHLLMAAPRNDNEGFGVWGLGFKVWGLGFAV